MKVELIKPFGVIITENAGSSLFDLDIKLLRKLFEDNHLIILRGFNQIENNEDLSLFAAKWGELSHWPFGTVFELKATDHPVDHIFDHQVVPLHWDGMYRKTIPEIQIFHCIKAVKENNQGRTVFTNTKMVLERLSEREKDVLRKSTGIYQRKMEFYDSITSSTIVTKHPYKNYEVIRFNEIINDVNFVNPPSIKFSNDQIHDLMISCLYDQRNLYAHQWQDGDVLIADNFTLLHGREAYQAKDRRLIKRVQVESQVPFQNPSLESYL